ncbi:hypothetical protein HAX54_011357 [Datura stramonium]|uniref:Uncharacterized protein n=1 Tax=Datura stramonium TaxID=4076 RepID=A0ABS8TJF5_DATST|nr:hypothetical protein [Datura stramonium]
MKDVFESLNKLCYLLDVVEGAVSSLLATVRELQNWASMADPEMRFLDKAMASPLIAQGLIDDLFAGFDEEDRPSQKKRVMRMRRLMMLKSSRIREFLPIFIFMLYIRDNNVDEFPFRSCVEMKMFF